MYNYNEILALYVTATELHKAVDPVSYQVKKCIFKIHHSKLPAPHKEWLYLEYDVIVKQEPLEDLVSPLSSVIRTNGRKPLGHLCSSAFEAIESQKCL